jgi:hypothetical protein
MPASNHLEAYLTTRKFGHLLLFRALMARIPQLDLLLVRSRLRGMRGVSSEGRAHMGLLRQVTMSLVGSGKELGRSCISVSC